MSRRMQAFSLAVALILGAPASEAHPLLDGEERDDRLEEAEHLESLAEVDEKEGRSREAVTRRRSALAIREQLSDPKDPDLAVSLYGLGRLLARLHEVDEAEALLGRAIAILEEAGQEHRRNLAVLLNKLAELHVSQTRFDQAERLYLRSKEILFGIPDASALDRSTALNNLGTFYHKLARYPEAEALFLQTLQIREKEVPDRPLELAQALTNLAEVYREQAKLEQAEPLYRRALEIYRAAGGTRGLVTTLNNLALLHDARAEYLQAEEFFREALRVLEQTPGADPLDLALYRQNLGELLITLGKYAEAGELTRSALAVREQILGEWHPDVASSLDGLARLSKSLGRLSEAEAPLRKSCEILERAFGDHPELGLCLNNLAELLVRQGRYGEAESCLERSRSIQESAFGSEHPFVATAIDNLAVLRRAQGRYEEAEKLFDSALRTRLAAFKKEEHEAVATSFNNIGALREDQGRLAEARMAHERALRIIASLLGTDHPRYAVTLQNLASVLESQGRLAKAEALYLQTQAILEKTLGPEHAELATVLSNLGGCIARQGRIEEAEALYRRTLSIREKALGPRHPDIASTLEALSTITFVKGQDLETEELLRRSLELRRAVLPEGHPEVTESLYNLAFLLQLSGRGSEVDVLVEEALRILEELPVYPERRAGLLWLKAKQVKAAGDLPRALNLLAAALGIVEGLRPGVGGGAETRASFLAEQDDLFHTMVAWQLEAGDIEQALGGTERRRGRILLEQLAEARVDWRTSVPEETRTPLVQAEEAARSHLAERQQRVRFLASEGEVPREEVASLVKAEEEYEEAYERLRNASSLWQRLPEGERIALATLQKDLVPRKGLLLLYELGMEESFLFVVGPPGDAPQALSLEVSAQSAAVLGVSPGPLKSADLDRLILGARSDASGLLGQLSRPRRRAGGTGMRVFFGSGSLPSLQESLHALWQVLVPEEIRPRLLESDEVVLLPDGSLHFLPFEALVLRRGSGTEEPAYWLDEGPVVRYAPSLAALRVLATRPAPTMAVEPSILSLSDPVFDPVEVARALQAPDTPLPLAAALADRSAALFEGPLDRLRGTIREREALVQAFGQARVRVLERLGATEEALRRELPGKRYIHLATHGLVDQQKASLFATLVLTPVPGATALAENDGFLQLHEIYELDLSACEMAVLSACQTHVGSSVSGEGVFALSRGMMVARAQRVIASQWSVNDASTAELIGELVRQLASMEEAGAFDYARALRDAKKRLRGKGRWAAPYYWAPFVLVGAR